MRKGRLHHRAIYGFCLLYRDVKRKPTQINNSLSDASINDVGSLILELSGAFLLLEFYWSLREALCLIAGVRNYYWSLMTLMSFLVTNQMRYSLRV